MRDRFFRDSVPYVFRIFPALAACFTPTVLLNGSGFSLWIAGQSILDFPRGSLSNSSCPEPPKRQSPDSQTTIVCQSGLFVYPYLGAYSLPSFDHLSTVPVHLTGKVLSVKQLREGQSFVICDDSGVNIGNRRRWVGHSQELTPVGTELKPGTRVQFLPGTPTRPGRMPGAYCIAIIRQAVN